MQRRLLSVSCTWSRVTVLFIFLWAFGFATVYGAPTHLDHSNMKKGCAECHRGHGKKGTPLLDTSKDEFCFKCHSLSGKASDIYSQVTKISKHPVLETSKYHEAGETLPEKDRSMPRHVSCYDCHNVHASEKGKALKGMRGYAGKGRAVKFVQFEYEVCYRCHSDSINLTNDEKNISLDFAPSNPSYHPVEMTGRNHYVPSLARNYTTSSMITCSDCHGNDEATGPKGPHGSTYDPILKYRYNRTSGSESPESYALCYQCHKRNSILSDESFKAHKSHVVYGQVSCAQCHDAHGGRKNPALINFDSTVSYPNSKGEFAYTPAVRGRPKCFLSCHVSGKVYEHKIDLKSLRYCVNDVCSTNW